jgi:hypothetical protein
MSGSSAAMKAGANLGAGNDGDVSADACQGT